MNLDILSENQISLRYKYIEMITTLGKVVDSLDIGNFYKRYNLPLCLRNLYILQ